MPTKFITVLITIVIYIFTPSQLIAQSSINVETMLRGNQLYESGMYEEAAQTYQQLLDLSVQDSTLYYNLGNAHFKQGNLGEAILSYERATQFAPRDSDIRSNLDLARSQIVDKYDATGASPLYQLVTLGSEWLTVNEMALAVVGLWIVFICLIIFYRRTKNNGLREALPYLLAVVGILWISSTLLLGNRLYMEQARPQAIILASEIDVRSGPGNQYTVEFQLHSGSKISIMEQRGDWVRLALPGEQLQGWAEANILGKIHTRTYRIPLP